MEKKPVSSDSPASDAKPGESHGVPPVNQRIEKAATLLLVRDAEQGSSQTGNSAGNSAGNNAGEGVEVFMLERPSRGAFPGLHVFTGGKVDPADAQLVAQMKWQGLMQEEAETLLNSSDAPLSYWLAAVRECFEESGVLLGTQDGKPLDAATVKELSVSRAEEFGGLCARLSITLTLDALVYFAHWVTPERAPRRFDTRFFVAPMPAGQTASFAPGETLSGEWVTPAEALARASDKRWNLIMPTLTSLRSLLPYASVAELLAGVRQFQHLPEYSEHFRSEGMQSGVNPALRD